MVDIIEESRKYSQEEMDSLVYRKKNSKQPMMEEWANLWSIFMVKK